MGLREKAIVSVLVMLALYAAAVATWFLYSEGAWKKARSRYESACRTFRKETETIANKDRYVEDLREIIAERIAAGKDVEPEDAAPEATAPETAAPVSTH